MEGKISLWWVYLSFKQQCKRLYMSMEEFADCSYETPKASHDLKWSIIITGDLLLGILFIDRYLPEILQWVWDDALALTSNRNIVVPNHQEGNDSILLRMSEIMVALDGCRLNAERKNERVWKAHIKCWTVCNFLLTVDNCGYYTWKNRYLQVHVVGSLQRLFQFSHCAQNLSK